MERKNLNKSRRRELVDYRHYAMHKLSVDGKLSISAIANILGVDRGCVYYGIQKYESNRKIYGDDYHIHPTYTPSNELKNKLFSDELPSKAKCEHGCWYFDNRFKSFRIKGDSSIKISSIQINKSN